MSLSSRTWKLIDQTDTCWLWLRSVTPSENIRRRYSTYLVCRNGHPYDEANTYRRPNGHRDCRACNRARVARYQGRAA